MSGQHTPGPWNISPTDWEDCHSGIYADEANSYLAVIVGTPDSDANARLIAAAPDLLAALVAATACLRSFHAADDFRALDDEAVNAALAAIAKAKESSMSAGYVIYRGPSALDGSPIVAIACALERSRNSKTGHMVQTYILRADMHPMEAVRSGADVAICGTCKHRGDGTGKERSCYVTLAHGPSHVWRSLGRGVYPDADPAEVGALLAGKMIRLGTYGDPAAVPMDVWQKLVHRAAGWTGYTHAWRDLGDDWARLLMASADTLAEAWAAQAAGWRTFRVGAGRLYDEVRCPASAEAGKKTVCADCRACMGLAGKAKASIVIAPHGNGARYARMRELEAA